MLCFFSSLIALLKLDVGCAGGCSGYMRRHLHCTCLISSAITSKQRSRYRGNKNKLQKAQMLPDFLESFGNMAALCTPIIAKFICSLQAATPHPSTSDCPLKIEAPLEHILPKEQMQSSVRKHLCTKTIIRND